MKTGVKYKQGVIDICVSGFFFFLLKMFGHINDIYAPKTFPPKGVTETNLVALKAN